MMTTNLWEASCLGSHKFGHVGCNHPFPSDNPPTIRGHSKEAYLVVLHVFRTYNTQDCIHASTMISAVVCIWVLIFSRFLHGWLPVAFVALGFKFPP